MKNLQVLSPGQSRQFSSMDPIIELIAHFYCIINYLCFYGWGGIKFGKNGDIKFSQVQILTGNSYLSSLITLWVQVVNG